MHARVPSRWRSALAIGVFGVALLAGCDSSGLEVTPAATADVTPTEPPTGTASDIPSGTPSAPASPAATEAAPEPPRSAELRPVTVVPDFRLSFDRPTDVVAYPLGGYALAVAEQRGQLLGVRPGEAEVILDLSGRMAGAGNEEGLLSIALDPRFEENSHLWVYYSNTGQPRRTVLSRFTAGPDGTIDPATELVVLEVSQPYQNHNGGAVRFGPDGMLYLGIGDGGSGGDPQGHGQDLGTLLGTVIRISVAGASEVEPYAIPDDNPFVGLEGAREEIWAYGVRNPWRMSFDPATGDLWLGDVGQNRQEEVDRIEAGGNYGWSVMEGHLCHPSPGCDPSPYAAPVAVYDRGNGRCSVTGGVVARDASATGVEGYYLFSDYCSGELWALPADAVPSDDGGASDDGAAEPVLIASGLGNITSINQVGDEIYLLAFSSPLLRLADE